MTHKLEHFFDHSHISNYISNYQYLIPKRLGKLLFNRTNFLIFCKRSAWILFIFSGFTNFFLQNLVPFTKNSYQLEVSFPKFRQTSQADKKRQTRNF